MENAPGCALRRGWKEAAPRPPSLNKKDTTNYNRHHPAVVGNNRPNRRVRGCGGQNRDFALKISWRLAGRRLLVEISACYADISAICGLITY
jgi:hypothetical protein